MLKTYSEDLPPVSEIRPPFYRSFSVPASLKNAYEPGYVTVSIAACRRNSVFHKPSNTDKECEPLLDPEKTQSKKFIKKKSDYLVLFSMALITYIGLCAFSMIAPFFPKMAKSKGVNETTIGFIFSVYPLIMFLCSPIVGKILPSIGPKFVLLIGCFIEGTSQIMFAYVSEIKSGSLFIIYCFVLRIVSAVGAACTSTAYITVLSVTFKEHVSTVFGLLELFTGLGLMTGPSLGGLLFKYGGFKLPFISLGVTVLVVMLVVVWVLPSDTTMKNKLEDGSPNGEQRTGKIFETLFIPGVFVTAFVVISGGMLISFLDPTLADHVSKVDPSLSTEMVGLVFLIGPGLYTVLAPIIGYLIDKKITPRVALCFGQFICGISFLFVGPSPITHIKGSLYLTCIALVILGLAIAPTIVPALADMRISALAYGLPDDLVTQGVLSGLFNAAFSMGSVIGPSLGGFLTEKISFEWASSIFGFYLFAQAIFVSLFTIYQRRT